MDAAWWKSCKDDVDSELSQHQLFVLTAAERPQSTTREYRGLRDLAQKEIAFRDASVEDMERSEEMSRRAKQSHRDAERMRLEDEARDRATRRDPEPDTRSEIELTRHGDFMHDRGPPPEMLRLEEVGLDLDDRVFPLLDDCCNHTSHSSKCAYKARYGSNKVTKEL